MKYTDVSFYCLLASGLLLGCAGPISPFGGLDVWSGDGEMFWLDSTEMNASDFSLYPRRQVLHRPSNLKIAFNLVETNSKEKPQLKVIYNRKDVTNTFLKSAKMREETENSEKQIQYVFNKLILKPDRKHKIDVYWREKKSESYSHLTYLPPECALNSSLRMTSTAPFFPKQEYITTIKSIALSQQLNPSLLAGLIAQESGFVPTRISYAKAVGLTQVTSIADEEIRKLRPDWNSDPRIDKLSVSEVENLILNKEIGKSQDWRLDPAQAIEGGALYLNYLINYWNLPENKSLLSLNPKTKTTAVILASYNSGAARVKSKIKANGEHWLDNSELKEAFKYVNSVVSYCYHFSEE